jgi:hypothetical protein
MKLDEFLPICDPKVLFDGTYRNVVTIPKFALMDRKDDGYLQHEWIRLYTESFRSLASQFYGRQEYACLRFIPYIREQEYDVILGIDVEVYPSKYKDVVIQTPKYEEWPVTFEYICREWKNTMNARIKKWWKGLFK